MKIEEVTVRNYKSFGASSPDISGFRNINMVFGYNNSGKSNFLKFIELIFKRKGSYQEVTYIEDGKEKQKTILGESANFWEGHISNMPFIFVRDKRDVPIDFKFRIRIDKKELGNIEAKLEKEYLSKTQSYATVIVEGKVKSINDNTSRIVLEEVRLGGKTIYKNDDQAKMSFFSTSSALKGNQELFDSFLGLFNDCVLFLGNDRNLSVEPKRDEQQYPLTPKTLKNWLFGLYTTANRHDEFLAFCDFLREFKVGGRSGAILSNNEKSSPLKQADIGFSISDDKIDLMLRNKLTRLPLSNYGTGIQQIFYILAKLFFSKSKIILIEELELNLSPKYQRELLNNLRDLIDQEKISQVFFTTHSKYFTFRSDFGIFETQISTRGSTNITRVRARRNINQFFRLDQ